MVLELKDCPVLQQRAQLIRVVVYFVEQASQDCFPASKWNSMPF
jgi:hypothetical protein